MAILLFFFFLFTSFAQRSCSTELYSHFIKQGLPDKTSQRFLEVTRPLSFSNSVPSCTLPILTDHAFGNTIGRPPITVAYSPPADCSWTHVALQLQGSCKGVQYDRIAAVWANGVEILRTSTPDPSDAGAYWTVTKDVTRYSSVLAKKNISVSVMLENVVNQVYTGVYLVNITFLHYDSKSPDAPLSDRKVKLEKDVSVDNPINLGMNRLMDSLNLYEKPADLIIPISGSGREGFWFKIKKEQEIHGRVVKIPRNTYKAVMEIYVSSHEYDEFWYSNPPDSYIQVNNLTTSRGNGAYREVLLNIDGNLVGTVVPFPVIYPGGVNPLFWDPVVSIGAFDLPSYDIDMTPHLGLLLDGKPHLLWLRVADSIPHWLVDANLHLWLDNTCGCAVQAKAAGNAVDPVFKIDRSSNFEGLDGTFETEMKRKTKVSGWVKSFTHGNLTTTISRELKLKNKVKFHDNGDSKMVEQKVKEETEIQVESDTGRRISHTILKREYPLSITTRSKRGNKPGTRRMLSELDHEWEENNKIRGDSRNTLRNRQQCKGWMLVHDRNVLLGGARTEQNYKFNGGDSSYSKRVTANNGELVEDAANNVDAVLSSM